MRLHFRDIDMNLKFFAALALLAVFLPVCVNISKSARVGFPAAEGRLIPKEKALEFVKSKLPEADDKGLLLYPIESASKGNKALHYGYYGCAVEIRQYQWPAEKGKPFALIITGTAGRDTQPGKRIYWFDTADKAKDVAMALVAMGSKVAQ